MITLFIATEELKLSLIEILNEQKSIIVALLMYR